MKHLISMLMMAVMIGSFQVSAAQIPKKVYIDKKGVIRWNDKIEVALFGANYCLPSACDYRAAGQVTQNRKALIDADMLHFARMGWDGLRLSFWGDFENSDKDGNLVNNDHLDLMDYLIFKAAERGIYMLLSPIVTYDSKWPDGRNDVVNGLSTVFRKNELGTNPQAIKAQQNYIRQILNHVNPYTGVALKDEPSILFIEMINEPTHHSDDFEGSVSYINALVDAVKSTGCKMPTFHNVTQDMKIAQAVKASDSDGATFAWYPMGLVGGHALTDNHLRAVDDFTPMHTPVLNGMPRVVYEFDEADSNTPYMYPAMTRSFRGVGAQFAAMFSYDMIGTAPYNLGWQTHLMNMVYYPQKAIGGIISSHLMKSLPLYKSYGNYPDNTTFGPCRISYEENLSEYNTAERFIYANQTKSMPVDISKLRQVIGYGSSPVVNYQGKGIYFIDKLSENSYRLEVYPDALLVHDPFEPMSKDKVVCRLVSREWPMTIKLSGLDETFYVLPLNQNNTFQTVAAKCTFSIKPGVYLLTTTKNHDLSTLPAKVGQVGIREFECPGDTPTPDHVLVRSAKMFHSGSDVVIRAEVQTAQQPSEVTLYYRYIKHSNWFIKVLMQQVDAYIWEARIPALKIPVGFYNYCITVQGQGGSKTFPGNLQSHPSDWNFYAPDQWQFMVIDKDANVPLLNLPEDCSYLAFTRIGDGGRHGIFDVLPATDQASASLRLFFPCEVDSTLDDYTVSLSIKDKINGLNIATAKALKVRVRGDLKGLSALVTLMESDGTSWSAPITVNDNWQEVIIPVSALKTGKGVLLPLGYPDRWNYWVTPALRRGDADDAIRLSQIERLQFSIRPGSFKRPDTNPHIDISLAELVF